MPLLQNLRERGFVASVSDEEQLAERLATGPIVAYCGYDITAPSLHVGNLVTIMLLAHLQRAGHRPLVLMGGGTTLIGDPSGKTSARPLLSSQSIEDNLPRIRDQFSRYLDFSNGSATMVNNADWLLPLHFLPFLRDIGRHFTVNGLLQHETYRDRLERESLSYLEITYALVQAYDFLHLFREENCILQVGGSDQWFNMLAGVDLIRRTESQQAYAWTAPIITLKSGQKMGKTEAGAVWLDASLTSPYDYYQFWRNTDDADVGRFLRLFTFLPLHEIQKLEALSGASINGAKEVLAYEATSLTHGEAEAQRARDAARARFEGQGLDQGPSFTLAEPMNLLDLLVASSLAESRNEAKRLLRGGGVRLGSTVQPEARQVQPSELPQLLIVGKRRLRLVPD